MTLKKTDDWASGTLANITNKLTSTICSMLDSYWDLMKTMIGMVGVALKFYYKILKNIFRIFTRIMNVFIKLIDNTIMIISRKVKDLITNMLSPVDALVIRAETNAKYTMESYSQLMSLSDEYSKRSPDYNIYLSQIQDFIEDELAWSRNGALNEHINGTGLGNTLFSGNLDLASGNGTFSTQQEKQMALENSQSKTISEINKLYENSDETEIKTAISNFVSFAKTQVNLTQLVNRTVINQDDFSNYLFDTSHEDSQLRLGLIDVAASQDFRSETEVHFKSIYFIKQLTGFPSNGLQNEINFITENKNNNSGIKLSDQKQRDESSEIEALKSVQNDDGGAPLTLVDYLKRIAAAANTQVKWAREIRRLYKKGKSTKVPPLMPQTCDWFKRCRKLQELLFSNMVDALAATKLYDYDTPDEIWDGVNDWYNGIFDPTDGMGLEDDWQLYFKRIISVLNSTNYSSSSGLLDLGDNGATKFEAFKSQINSNGISFSNVGKLEKTNLDINITGNPSISGKGRGFIFDRFLRKGLLDLDFKSAVLSSVTNSEITFNGNISGTWDPTKNSYGDAYFSIDKDGEIVNDQLNSGEYDTFGADYTTPEFSIEPVKGSYSGKIIIKNNKVEIFYKIDNLLNDSNKSLFYFSSNESDNLVNSNCTFVPMKFNPEPKYKVDDQGRPVDQPRAFLYDINDGLIWVKHKKDFFGRIFNRPVLDNFDFSKSDSKFVRNSSRKMHNLVQGKIDKNDFGYDFMQNMGISMMKEASQVSPGDIIDQVFCKGFSFYVPDMVFIIAKTLMDMIYSWIMNNKAYKEFKNMLMMPLRQVKKFARKYQRRARKVLNAVDNAYGFRQILETLGALKDCGGEGGCDGNSFLGSVQSELRKIKAKTGVTIDIDLEHNKWIYDYSIEKDDYYLKFYRTYLKAINKLDQAVEEMFLI